LKKTYALVGNPNSGKTTLFNAITGGNQTVGNFPGVTVEQKIGQAKVNGNNIQIVDLPGIYSLFSYGAEEVITKNYIVNEDPDVIINIVDATNIERNLYLTLQLAELGKPIVIALNMIDMVEKKGDIIDTNKLSSLFGMEIIPISASKSKGIDKLLTTAAHQVLHEQNNNHFDKHEKREIILGLYDNIDSNLSEDEKYMIIADRRYKYICNACELSIIRGEGHGKPTISDKIDKIVTNKFLAIPLFLAIMLFVFLIAFGKVGSTLTEFTDNLINNIFANFIRAGLVNMGVRDWAVGLTCDGVINGVGTVLSFFPQILLLFLFLSILEDTGYMARAAFIMDRALHKLGLSGKSFVPMLMGFGCTVPAVMATRTLQNEKDRRLTIMLTPFMSCSAKMPIYALFTLAFFPKYHGLIVFSLYLIRNTHCNTHSIYITKNSFKRGTFCIYNGITTIQNANY